MSAYVLLALSAPRASWPNRMSHPEPKTTLHMILHQCASMVELRARLCSGRAFSAVLLDGNLAESDPDVFELAHRCGCATIVVTRRDEVTGCSATLYPDFTINELGDVLHRVATVVPDVTVAPFSPTPRPLPKPWSGRLVAVCGTGGTGASTVAIAIARSLGATGDQKADVLLADLALDADQALLHGIADDTPTIVDLIDEHRRAHARDRLTRRFAVSVADRGYHLLPGLRRHAEWTVLREQRVHAATVGMLDSFDVVVADVDADVEGDADCGVIEVEDRNVLARCTMPFADAVVVVTAPGLKGLHALARCARRIITFGVDPSVIVPVVNRTDAQPAQHAEFTAAFTSLVPTIEHPPVFVPALTEMEAMHRRLSPPPERMCQALTPALRCVLGRPRHAMATDVPEQVQPGSGAWRDHEPVTI